MLICPSHNQSLEKYCYSCHQLFCESCSSHLHHGHNEYDIRKTSVFEMGEDSLRTDVDEEIEKIENAIAGLKSREEEITSQGELIKEELREVKDRIIVSLNKAEEVARKDIVDAVNHKVSILQQQMQSAEEILARLKECRENLNGCKSGVTRQQTLLYQSQMVCRTRSAIQSSKKRSFNPLEKPDIQFSWKKLESSVKRHARTISYQFHPSSVLFEPKSESVLMTDESTAINVMFPHSIHGGHLMLTNISCRVFPVRPKQPSVPVVIRIPQEPNSHQISVEFTPKCQGPHKLQVIVNGVEVPNSPFIFEVTPSPTMRRTIVKTMSDLSAPCGLDITNCGDVVVTELNSNHVTVLDGGGKKMKSFHLDKKDSIPFGLACSSQGTVYVTDRGRHEISEYTLNGECVACVGEMGTFALQFNEPMGVAVDKNNGKIYVADTKNHRIQVLKCGLSFERMFGSKGSDKGLFNEPSDVAVDVKGCVYVADSGNRRVQKFTHRGEFLFTFGGSGYGHSKMMRPVGMAVDRNNFVYVSDLQNHYISVYDASGMFVYLFGNIESEPASTVDHPFHLAFDESLLYVCDLKKNRICVF